MKQIGKLVRVLAVPLLVAVTSAFAASAFAGDGFDPISQQRLVETVNDSLVEDFDGTIYSYRNIDSRRTLAGDFGAFNASAHIEGSPDSASTATQNSSFALGLIRYDGSVQTHTNGLADISTTYDNIERATSIFSGSFRFAKPHDVLLSMNSVVGAAGSTFDFALRRGSLGEGTVVRGTSLGHAAGNTSASFTELVHLVPGQYSFGTELTSFGASDAAVRGGMGEAHWSLAVAAVPEPSTIALMALGLAFVVGGAIRRRGKR